MRQLAVIVGGILVIVFLYTMNVKGIQDTEDNSMPMDTFVNAADWLSKNMGPNDLVLVPHPAIFYSLNPQLKKQLVDYRIVWNEAGVTWQANTTNYEIAYVQQYLESVVRHDPRLKYLIVEWFYPYSTRIFTTQSCSDLGDLLHEVKRFDFQTLHVKWKNKLVICGINGKT